MKDDEEFKKALADKQVPQRLRTRYTFRRLRKMTAKEEKDNGREERNACDARCQQNF